ncbi:putative serine/threonine-protein kinase [Smittium mucronatum]|uniref:Putative serine/threonine-protein kinase n=1 Tax=Smittium mucronatum TaxID=133383 RepID=A0A1R0GRL0_9FUNG|nr:putative serine/threonine-protein kinase [Smittium mucronatum]
MNRYQEIKIIGEGAFSSVILATNRSTKEMVAIKKMKKKKVKDILAIAEIAALKKMNNPNVITLLDDFKDGYHSCLVFELMDFDLNVYAEQNSGKVFSDLFIMDISCQVLNGISHIHEQGFFHRDLKPENILLRISGNDVLAKISDFGLVHSMEFPRPLTAYVSTRWYRAPEVLLACSFYAKPVDIWAMGTIVAELATSKPLFPGNNQLDQLRRIFDYTGSPNSPQKDEIEWAQGIIAANELGLSAVKIPTKTIDQLMPNVLPEIKSFVALMIKLNPDLRPSANLAHEKAKEIYYNLISKNPKPSLVPQLKAPKAIITPPVSKVIEITTARRNPFSKSKQTNIQNGFLKSQDSFCKTNSNYTEHNMLHSKSQIVDYNISEHVPEKHQDLPQGLSQPKFPLSNSSKMYLKPDKNSGVPDSSFIKLIYPITDNLKSDDNISQSHSENSIVYGNFRKINSSDPEKNKSFPKTHIFESDIYLKTSSYQKHSKNNLSLDIKPQSNYLKNKTDTTKILFEPNRDCIDVSKNQANKGSSSVNVTISNFEIQNSLQKTQKSGKLFIKDIGPASSNQLHLTSNLSNNNGLKSLDSSPYQTSNNVSNPKSEILLKNDLHSQQNLNSIKSDYPKSVINSNFVSHKEKLVTSNFSECNQSIPLVEPNTLKNNSTTIEKHNPNKSPINIEKSSKPNLFSLTDFNGIKHHQLIDSSIFNNNENVGHHNISKEKQLIQHNISNPTPLLDRSISENHFTYHSDNFPQIIQPSKSVSNRESAPPSKPTRKKTVSSKIEGILNKYQSPITNGNLTCSSSSIPIHDFHENDDNKIKKKLILNNSDSNPNPSIFSSNNSLILESHLGRPPLNSSTIKEKFSDLNSSENSLIVEVKRKSMIPSSSRMTDNIPYRRSSVSIKSPNISDNDIEKISNPIPKIKNIPFEDNIPKSSYQAKFKSDLSILKSRSNIALTDEIVQTSEKKDLNFLSSKTSIDDKIYTNSNSIHNRLNSISLSKENKFSEKQYLNQTSSYRDKISSKDQKLLESIKISDKSTNLYSSMMSNSRSAKFGNSSDKSKPTLIRVLNSKPNKDSDYNVHNPKPSLYKPSSSGCENQSQDLKYIKTCSPSENKEEPTFSSLSDNHSEIYSNILTDAEIIIAQDSLSKLDLKNNDYEFTPLMDTNTSELQTLISKSKNKCNNKKYDALINKNSAVNDSSTYGDPMIKSRINSAIKKYPSKHKKIDLKSFKSSLEPCYEDLLNNQPEINDNSKSLEISSNGHLSIPNSPLHDLNEYTEKSHPSSNLTNFIHSDVETHSLSHSNISTTEGFDSPIDQSYNNISGLQDSSGHPLGLVLKEESISTDSNYDIPLNLDIKNATQYLPPKTDFSSPVLPPIIINKSTLFNSENNPKSSNMNSSNIKKPSREQKKYFNYFKSRFRPSETVGSDPSMIQYVPSSTDQSSLSFASYDNSHEPTTSSSKTLMKGLSKLKSPSTFFSNKKLDLQKVETLNIEITSQKKANIDSINLIHELDNNGSVFQNSHHEKSYLASKQLKPTIPNDSEQSLKFKEKYPSAFHSYKPAENEDLSNFGSSKSSHENVTNVSSNHADIYTSYSGDKNTLPLKNKVLKSLKNISYGARLSLNPITSQKVRQLRPSIALGDAKTFRNYSTPKNLDLSSRASDISSNNSLGIQLVDESDSKSILNLQMSKIRNHTPPKIYSKPKIRSRSSSNVSGSLGKYKFPDINVDQTHKDIPITTTSSIVQEDKLDSAESPLHISKLPTHTACKQDLIIESHAPKSSDSSSKPVDQCSNLSLYKFKKTLDTSYTTSPINEESSSVMDSELLSKSFVNSLGENNEFRKPKFYGRHSNIRFRSKNHQNERYNTLPNIKTLSKDKIPFLDNLEDENNLFKEDSIKNPLIPTSGVGDRNEDYYLNNDKTETTEKKIQFLRPKKSYHQDIQDPKMPRPRHKSLFKARFNLESSNTSLDFKEKNPSKLPSLNSDIGAPIVVQENPPYNKPMEYDNVNSIYKFLNESDVFF